MEKITYPVTTLGSVTGSCCSIHSCCWTKWHKAEAHKHRQCWQPQGAPFLQHWTSLNKNQSSTSLSSAAGDATADTPHAPTAWAGMWPPWQSHSKTGLHTEGQRYVCCSRQLQTCNFIYPKRHLSRDQALICSHCSPAHFQFRPALESHRGNTWPRNPYCSLFLT